MNKASIWPFDYLIGDYPNPSIDSVTSKLADIEISFRCFIVCPFSPNERANALREIVERYCKEITEGLQQSTSDQSAERISYTVDMFPWAGTIHSDIWRCIRDSDVIVADLTGENPNVMYELGVAAAIKPDRQVIIITNADPAFTPRFDIQPLRHLTYSETMCGDTAFLGRFRQALVAAVTSLPFARRRSKPVDIENSRRWILMGTDTDEFITPAHVHRAPHKDGLYFGGLSFPHSWLCIGNLDVRNVFVKMRVRFARGLAPLNDHYVAVALRASHYYANFSQMFYIRQADGIAVRTVPKLIPGQYFDHSVHEDLASPIIVPGSNWIEITHGIDDSGQLVGINDRIMFYNHGDPKSHSQRGPGRILIQVYQCIVQIGWIEVGPPSDLRTKSTVGIGDTPDY